MSTTGRIDECACMRASCAYLFVLYSMTRLCWCIDVRSRLNLQTHVCFSHSCAHNDDDGDDDEIEYLFVDVRKIQKEVVTLWQFPCQYCPNDNNYDGTMCCVSLSTLFTSTFPSFLPVTLDTLRANAIYCQNNRFCKPFKLTFSILGK